VSPLSSGKSTYTYPPSHPANSCPRVFIGYGELFVAIAKWYFELFFAIAKWYSELFFAIAKWYSELF